MATVGVFAFDQQSGLGDSRLFPRLHVLHFNGEPAALGPPGIHPEKHIGPVIGLRATGAGLDGEDGVVTIESTGQERGDFDFVDRRRQLLHGGDEFRTVFGLFFGGAGRDELQHDIHVVQFLAKLHDRDDRLFQAVDLSNMPLGLVVIIPETGGAHLGVQRFYFSQLLFAVKETSITVRPVS